MQNTIYKRIFALRKFMEDKNLHAFIIPTTDAHLSEYPVAHWSAREWISGFTGSAGTIVVTTEKAGLWTDSRYFLQAEQELKDSSIDLYKEGIPDTPTIDQWLEQELTAGNNVGIDGTVFAAKDAFRIILNLQHKGIHTISDYDPFATIWHDRPSLPSNPIFVLPVDYSGLSASHKIETVCENLDQLGAESILIASLDTIAWLFNIRGNDVKCNPVSLSFAYVSRKETVLFIDPKKLTKETREYLVSEGIKLAEYSKIYDYVSSIADTNICITGNKISLALYNNIPAHCNILDIPSPIDLLKSIKNETEINGFRSAMERDGVALTKFFMWLESAIGKEFISEITIADKLVEFRSQQNLYVGESFDTIAGYQENGAIVHYHATEGRAAQIKPEGLLLIDSGAQYFDGTTDITRTLAVGVISEQMKQDYTLVLKGHIAIATARYPQGTRGSQLDILARKALWNKGLNYLHGTGHGIGHFLNVHEGPQNIRMDENPTALQPGMITSNEPGMYRTDEYGIRIENLVLTQEDIKTEFGTFYSFETLTLCPIDTTPIVKDLMSNDEIEWLNSYHTMVYNRLSPSLSEEEKSWLKEKTKAI